MNIKKNLTKRDASKRASRIIDALDEHDVEAVHAAIFEGYEPTARNYLVALGVLTSVIGVAVMDDAPTDDDAFFGCEYADDAPPAVRYAAQLTAAASNGDHETVAALGVAILNDCYRADTLDLYEDVTAHLTTVLHQIIHPGAGKRHDAKE